MSLRGAAAIFRQALVADGLAHFEFRRDTNPAV
jgi:hypothetical protein